MQVRALESVSSADPLSRNLTSRKGFPHRAAHTLWIEGYFKYAEDCAKDNQKDYEEARTALKNGTAKTGPATSPFEEAGDTRVATNILYSDLTKLMSFVLNREPKPRCVTAKGPALKASAKAVERMVKRVYREMGFAAANRACLTEALLREHGNIRLAWDHYRQLPFWTHCENEVYWDPDGGGDPKRCKWVMELVEMPLYTVLEDPEISPAIKKELKEKTEAHRKTRADGDSYSRVREHELEGAGWDNQPQMKKVLVIRVWSANGVLPGAEDKPEVGEDIERREMATPHGVRRVGTVMGEDGEQVDALEEEMRHNPHAAWKPPPEVQDDAPPDAPNYDPSEANRRVYMMFVKDFPKVLKVTPWPMDHYDRGEWPILECNFLRLPGDVHGIPWYRVIKENIDIINKALTTAINDTRYGARKIVEAEEGAFADNAEELQKLSNPKNQYEVVKVQHIGGIKVTEFAGRDKSYLNLIPIIKDLHDEATGVNDIVRGQSGDVQKTKYEAQQLADQTAAALSYLQEAIERFLEEQARLTVGALLYYVEKQSQWTEPDPCALCAGSGTPGQVGSEAFGEQTVLGPAMVPCPRCQGSGIDPHGEKPEIIKRGADFWLEEQDAAAWPDGLSIDEIRAEIIVGIKSGSTRRDYVEREVNTLRNAGQDLVPFYDKLGPQGTPYHRAYVEEILTTLGVDEPERFVPDEATLQGILQQQEMQQQAAMQAEAEGKAPPQVDPAIQEAEETKAAEDSARADNDFALKAEEANTKREIEMRKLSLAEEQGAAAAEPKERELALKEEVERRKLALEEHRAQADAASAQQTAQGFMGMVAEMTKVLQALHQSVQASEARGVEQSVAVVGAIERVAQLAAQIAESADGVGVTAGEGAKGTVASIEELKQIMLAPVKVIRDADGQVQGAERDMRG